MVQFAPLLHRLLAAQVIMCGFDRHLLRVKQQHAHPALARLSPIDVTLR